MVNSEYYVLYIMAPMPRNEERMVEWYWTFDDCLGDNWWIAFDSSNRYKSLDAAKDAKEDILEFEYTDIHTIPPYIGIKKITVTSEDVV